MRNRQIVLSQLPEGELKTAHFKLQETDLPAPGPNEVLIKTLFMSLDAANRAWMQGRTYRDALAGGDLMPTYTIGRIERSDLVDLPVGALVESDGFWADYIVRPAEMVTKVPEVSPLSRRLSVLGIAGKTAYFGLLDVGQPKSGETLIVSAAAGSVGSIVGQIGKIKGCHVVGIAGGQEKCDWLVNELGFDAAVDYKSGRLMQDLKTACPNGVDIYFDNVGGTVLETVLYHMNLKGRVVCCGAVSQYDEEKPVGPRNLPGLVVVRRLRMEGFIVNDYLDDDAEAERDLNAWVNSGQLKVAEDIIEGLENAPAALIGLLKGDNRGKRMIQVASER